MILPFYVFALMPFWFWGALTNPDDEGNGG
jgi:hypothetical protein